LVWQLRELKKDELEYFLHKQMKAFQKLIIRTHRNPKNKNVHDFRICIRRMRVALWLLSHASPHLRCNKLCHSLDELGGVLGECRELDVAIQDATHYHFKIEKLKYLRRQKRIKVQRITGPQNSKKILSQLSHALKKTHKKTDVEFRQGIIKMRKRIGPWTRKNPQTAEELHSLRIEVKKIRYALEIMGAPVQPLKKLQFCLGRAHDLEVLRKYFKNETGPIQHVIQTQNEKAKHLVRPTLRYAYQQFGLSSNKYQIENVTHNKSVMGAYTRD
jgi:CHAD domain-containing protein